MKSIKSNLINVVKSGRSFVYEEVIQFQSLSEEERDEIMDIALQVRERKNLEDVQKYFKKVLKKNRTEREKHTESVFIPNGLQAGCELDFLDDPTDTVYNEAFVMIIQDPLTPDEVKEIAKTQLLKNNIGLVQKSLIQFNNNNYEGKFSKEDLLQEAKQAFFKAVNYYRCGCNTKFSTYCMTIMHNDLVSLHNNKLNKMKAREESFDEPIGFDDDTKVSKMDLYIDPNQETPESIAARDQTIDCLRELVNALDPEPRFIITTRYGLYSTRKLTQTEVAEFLNMSQANVSKIENNALKELKEKMQNLV